MYEIDINIDLILKNGVPFDVFGEYPNIGLIYHN